MFNQVKQICDWPKSVAPPCGTNTTEFSEGGILENIPQLNLEHLGENLNP